MKTTKAVRFGNIAIAAVTGLLLTLPVHAEIKSHSANLIIEQPADLPEMARTPGQSLFLYQAGDGETYLYVEQQNGARLAIFDVTDPAKIKASASVPMNAPGAFDFVRYRNNRAELIRFRESGQLAELDLRNPKSPALKIASALSAPGHTESLGETGLGDDQCTLQVCWRRRARLSGRGRLESSTSHPSCNYQASKAQDRQ